MAFTNFLNINLPYVMQKDLKTNKWFCLNREFMPLGWNNKNNQETIFLVELYDGYDFKTEYLKLNDKDIKEIFPLNHLKIENGIVIQAYFYMGNPLLKEEEWSAFVEILRKCQTL